MAGRAVSVGRVGGALAVVGAMALAGALPAGAGAAGPSLRGAVVAKDQARGTLAIAAGGGRVVTLRPTAGVGRYRVGQRIAAAAGRRADGTYEARRVRVDGRAGAARVRAVLVGRSNRGYLLSAGSSTFSIRARAASTPAGLAPGAVVVARLALGAGGASSRALSRVGEAAMVEIEGILLSSGADRLELAVAGRGRVAVTLPAGLAVAAAPGDEIELLVSVGEDGSFTLVALSGEDDEGGLDLDAEAGEVEVEGVLSALSEDSVSVSASAAGMITCSVPAGVSLAGFAIGEAVEMECTLREGAFELRELESEHAEVEIDDDEEEEEEAAPSGTASRFGRR